MLDAIIGRTATIGSDGVKHYDEFTQADCERWACVSNATVRRRLGPPDMVLSEEALAKIFRRHRVSIKRAVERGGLPPSVRLFGEPVWTVQALTELAESIGESAFSPRVCHICAPQACRGNGARW